MKVLEALTPLDSPARVEPAAPRRLRVAAIQHRWHPDPAEHRRELAAAVEKAASGGASLVCMQELTLSPYFAQSDLGPEGSDIAAEEIPTGATSSFAIELARELGVHVHASLYERAEEVGDRRGFNTAIVASPDGEIVARTRKLHIPVTSGYHEDLYFRPGPPDEPAPTVSVRGACCGFPTCWDQWFPELARSYSLAGAEILVYPTAIGSEPDHPDFDTEPLWEKVIVAQGIANGTFMVAVNRIGTEEGLTFYGSSFISDPYGRKLVQAPRDEPAVLIAELDLTQRADWLELFPFLTTRRPDAYGLLVEAARPGQRG